MIALLERNIRDGQVVLHNTQWNQANASGTVNVTPGWVDFEVRFNGGGGGTGMVGDMGFGFDPTGAATSVDPLDYILRRNSNDTTADLFRTRIQGPIDMTGVDLTVTADSTIDVVTHDSATFAAPLMKAGILTTTRRR